MNNYNILWQEVKEQLEELKKVLPEELDSTGSKLFDEFIRENELGLALHIICDHLLESTAQPVTPAVVGKIQSLHSAMEIEDTCVADLQTKTPPAKQ